MTTPTSRRDFLKTSAVAAGTAALLAGGVHAAGQDVIRVGLVGCGGRGTGAAGNCLEADPSVRLVAVGDTFEDRANSAVRRLKGEYKERVDVGQRVFIGLNAYKDVIANCDLVILATPPGFRPQHIQAVIAAGKHLFTEKPVAVDGPGIRTVLAAYEEAKKKNLAVVAGTQRRHQNTYNEIMKRIHGGEIGEIVAGRCYWNMGKLWHRDREPGMSDVVWQIRNWLYFTWLSGDHIVEQHVHNLDVINWALQAHPVSCVGLGGRQVRTGPEFGMIFDHHAIDFEYPNGVHVLSMCRQQEGTAGSVSEAVVGTKATSITADKKTYTFTNYKGEKLLSLSPKQDNQPYVQEHIDLIRSIMGRMASYTGQNITWDMALNSKEALVPEQLTLDMTLPVAPVPMPGKTKFV
jgi:myo-inositol 2-dehydrogenase/D-chiro-inositol 1-dehydrogenase